LFLLLFSFCRQKYGKCTNHDAGYLHCGIVQALASLSVSAAKVGNWFFFSYHLFTTLGINPVTFNILPMQK